MLPESLEILIPCFFSYTLAKNFNWQSNIGKHYSQNQMDRYTYKKQCLIVGGDCGEKGRGGRGINYADKTLSWKK